MPPLIRPFRHSALAPVAAAALVCCAGIAAAAEPKLKLLETVDVPGFTAEILGYCPDQRWLLSTNPLWKMVDLFDVESLDPPRITPVDLDDEAPGIQGLEFVGEPTSLAVHPSLPIVFVAETSRVPGRAGTVHAFDLRRGQDTLGRWVLRQEVGIHPDSLSISPDGRWLVVACEAEGDPTSPGSIWTLDLTGLTPDRRAREGDLPATQLPGLARLMDHPLGDLEPEYVAFDPQSRLALVTFQENDSFVTVDLTTSTQPRAAAVTRLSYESEPDGIDLLDDIPGPAPGSPLGLLVAVAGEGKFNQFGQTTGNCLSLHWLNPAAPDQPAVPLSRTDIRPLVSSKNPDKRRDPESVRLLRDGDRVLALLGIERGDCVLLLDVTDATAPKLLDKADVGERPEGLLLVRDGNKILLLTGDEGNEGPGTISFLRLTGR